MLVCRGENLDAIWHPWPYPDLNVPGTTCHLRARIAVEARIGELRADDPAEALSCTASLVESIEDSTLDVIEAILSADRDDHRPGIHGGEEVDSAPLLAVRELTPSIIGRRPCSMVWELQNISVQRFGCAGVVMQHAGHAGELHVARQEHGCLVAVIVSICNAQHSGRLVGACAEEADSLVMRGV